MTVIVTNHAVQRYQERVADVPEREARKALSTPFIERAIELGFRAVKLGSGHRVVIDDGKVVTVHPKEARFYV